MQVGKRLHGQQLVLAVQVRIERGLELLERRIPVAQVVRRFGPGHILRHVGRCQVEARGRKIRIEIDRHLEIVRGSRILSRLKRVDALIQVVPGLKFVTTGAQYSEGDQGTRH